MLSNTMLRPWFFHVPLGPPFSGASPCNGLTFSTYPLSHQTVPLHLSRCDPILPPRAFHLGTSGVISQHGVHPPTVFNTLSDSTHLAPGLHLGTSGVFIESFSNSCHSRPGLPFRTVWARSFTSHSQTLSSLPYTILVALAVRCRSY